MPDRLGPLQQDVLATEEALNYDIRAERLLRERRQGVAAQRRPYLLARTDGRRHSNGRAEEG